MKDRDRARVLPTLFVVGGVIFAFGSVSDDLPLSGQVFGVVVGVLVAAYGGWRLRQERLRPPDEPPDERAEPPGA